MKIETRQQFRERIFRLAWEGFEKQGWEVAVDEDGWCLWQTKDGRRCGIGHLIPDLGEGRQAGSWRSAIRDRRLLPELLDFAVSDLSIEAERDLVDLQRAHDGSSGGPAGGSLRERMALLILRWGLHDLLEELNR